MVRCKTPENSKQLGEGEQGSRFFYSLIMHGVILDEIDELASFTEYKSTSWGEFCVKIFCRTLQMVERSRKTTNALERAESHLRTLCLIHPSAVLPPLFHPLGLISRGGTSDKTELQDLRLGGRTIRSGCSWIGNPDSLKFRCDHRSPGAYVWLDRVIETTAEKWMKIVDYIAALEVNSAILGFCLTKTTHCGRSKP
jgi:hypothetical protein